MRTLALLAFSSLAVACAARPIPPGKDIPIPPPAARVELDTATPAPTPAVDASPEADPDPEPSSCTTMQGQRAKLEAALSEATALRDEYVSTKCTPVTIPAMRHPRKCGELSQIVNDDHPLVTRTMVDLENRISHIDTRFRLCCDAATRATLTTRQRGQCGR